ncbi:MAG: 30S ribosomal protein S1 [Clostridia bacterium]|nr:30S ribosomal protein S1 [Clostridia bacterium]
MKEFYPEGIKTSLKEKSFYTLAEISAAAGTDEILEATALLCDEGHNLIVELGCMKGVIPREEGAIGIKEGRVRDIAVISRVGKSVCFTVTDVSLNKNGEPVALLSRRRAQQRFINEGVENMRVGDITEAVVTHLDSFGVFCDIGCGVIALLPIDCISVSRIGHPKDRFKVGDNIRVILKSISEDGRITVSHKELLGTWAENASLFTAGQTVSGVVRSVEDYGVFVELTPNLAGLAENYDTKVGNTASVYIKSIIPEKMKVKLIIIDSFQSSYSPFIKYFYEGAHIDRFDYSPPSGNKKIFTEFG